MIGSATRVIVGSLNEGEGSLCLKCTQQDYYAEHDETVDKGGELEEWIQRTEKRRLLIKYNRQEFAPDGLYCVECGEEIFEQTCAGCGGELGKSWGHVSKVGGALFLNVSEGDIVCEECMKQQAKAEQGHAKEQAALAEVRAWDMTMETCRGHKGVR